MNICIISQDYPNIMRPAAYVFLQNFAWTASDLGHSITIICPLNIIRDGNKKIPYHYTETTIGGNTVNVYFPKFISGWYTYRSKRDLVAEHSHKCFIRAIDRVLRKSKIKPDLFYGEFLDPAGTAAAVLKRKYKCKAIASFGESSFWTLSKRHIEKDIEVLNQLDGIESVSTENKRRLLEYSILDEDRIVVLPNAIDPKRYYKKDKLKSREKFGFRKDAFIVAFLGGFIDRKGVLRVEKALRDVDDVYVAYAGKGPQVPKAKNTIFCNEIAPESVSDFLSAADVFVLPTKNEGCCNAIIEAMAAGLPIISSNLPFNDDILNDRNSIRIDPNSIEDIRSAVLMLKLNKNKRIVMGSESLRIAYSLRIEERVKSVVNFVEQL